MKCTKVILCGLIAGVAMVNAMPTLEQTKKVEPLVMDLMREDQNALKSGKKTRAEVAQSAMELAEKAESEAAKLLLMKGAFHLYVRAGEFDRAIETLQKLRTTIPDMPLDNLVRIIESSLRVVSRKNGGQLYRILDETKTRVRYTKEVETLEKSVKRTPSDRTLRLQLAEHYVYLDKWDLALENFAATDGKAGIIAKSERDGNAITEKVADFWWNYPTDKADELVKSFRIHAAKLYANALASGDIKGLNKVQAERRIEEAKGYGESFNFESLNMDSKSEMDAKYCVIDVSEGANANRYAVTYLAERPKEGWTLDDKTKRIVLRKVKAGADPLGRFSISKDYYIGLFEITQKQWESVIGTNPSKHKREQFPATNMSVFDIRGVKGGKVIGKDGFVGKLAEKTGLSGFDLPTEAQWQYAGRVGATTKLGDVWERCLDNASPLSGVDPVGNISGKIVANCKWDRKKIILHAGTNWTNPCGDRGFRIVLNLK